MKAETRLAATVFLSALALVVFGQCRRQEAPQQAPGATVTPASADAARGLAAPSPPSPIAADAAPAGAPPDAGGSPASVGDWLDGAIYRFRLEAIRRCEPPPTPAGTARIGVLVRVNATKVDALLVAPRDFKLEGGGVILDSAVLPKAPAGCTPLLATKSVRAGKTADGVVVFDVPPGFNPAHRPVKLSYQPTRWGGARRVEAVLPSGSLPP